MHPLALLLAFGCAFALILLGLAFSYPRHATTFSVMSALVAVTTAGLWPMHRLLQRAAVAPAELSSDSKDGP